MDTVADNLPFSIGVTYTMQNYNSVGLQNSNSFNSNEALETFKFWNIKLDTSFFKAFIKEIHKQAEKCNFMEKERMIRDKIVFSVSEKLRQYLFAESYLDLPRTIDICESFDCSEASPEQATGKAEESSGDNDTSMEILESLNCIKNENSDSTIFEQELEEVKKCKNEKTRKTRTASKVKKESSVKTKIKSKKTRAKKKPKLLKVMKSEGGNTSLNDSVLDQENAKDIDNMDCSVESKKTEKMSTKKSAKKAVKIHKCPHCDKEFTNRGNLGMHVRNRHEKLSLSCPKCSEEFKDCDSLLLHIRSHSEEESYICTKCQLSFTTSDLLADHLEQSTCLKQTQGLHKCPNCDKEFNNRGNLRMHVRNRHMKPVMQCPMCEEQFHELDSLLAHVRDHTGEESYECKKCDVNLMDADGLAEHLQHSKCLKKPPTLHECDQCGKKFPFTSRLRRHQRRHMGEKTFICSDCGRGFFEKSYLTRHKLTHTGEKPFSCVICNKGFTIQSNLKKHLATHSDARPCMCETCGKTFNHSGNLARHKKRSHMVKKIKCALCGRMFSDNDKLKTHMRVHTGEKPYKCSVCGKAFAELGNRNQHLKTHKPKHSSRYQQPQEQPVVTTASITAVLPQPPQQQHQQIPHAPPTSLPTHISPFPGVINWQHLKKDEAAPQLSPLQVPPPHLQVPVPTVPGDTLNSYINWPTNWTPEKAFFS